MSVAGDPLADLARLEHPDTVIKGGVVFVRDGRPVPRAAPAVP